MNHPSLGSSATALTTLALATAMVTDLRHRRIPNLLTFPAMIAGLVLWTTFLGWKGLALSVCGMFAAPLLLVLLHLGRGPGMGDIKLAASVGALLGPRLSPVAMLLTALAGGLLALGSQLRGGGALANAVTPFLVGVPWLQRWAKANPVREGSKAPETIPYAVGIAIGSMLALAVYWCTGKESWFL